jgi:protein-lysine N-methyltransferase EEF2KMT
MNPLSSLPQPPTSSLPPLRSLDGAVEETVLAALRNLYALYCPLSSALLAVDSHPKTKFPTSGTATPLVDSGYVSGADEEDDYDDDQSGDGAEDALDSLRADAFERNFATRWLTGFIGRAEDLAFWSSENVCEDAINQASYVLASFSTALEEDAYEEDAGIFRNFSFAIDPSAVSATTGEPASVDVRLLDKPICTGTDHTDVGLQSWASSIVFSDVLCASPTRFGMTGLGRAPRILELGAGTGLVGLALAKLLPQIGTPDADIIATDYHPAVLDNLRDNIRANFAGGVHGSADDDRAEVAAAPITTCLLDWAAPTFDAPLDCPADVLVAADVIYAPEHAVWLRDCAARYLAAPHGVFWLMVAVRQHGKFEGIVDTVEAAFADRALLPRDAEGRRVLDIMGQERFAKRDGVGRGDEKGYVLFRIGWVEQQYKDRKRRKGGEDWV